MWRLAAVSQVSSVWLLSLIAGVRARWYVWFVTVVFLTVAAVNIAVLPITGTVTSVERVSTSWGVISVLRRQSPSSWVGALYALSLSINVFGYICAAREWSRDRVGGLLIAVANTGGVVVALWALQIDTAGSNQPYLGAVHYPLWVLLVASQIARNYRLRVDQRNQALQALEHSREQLRRLTAGLLMAREEERTAIAREIHDVLGQALTALKMDVSWIGARSPADAPAAIRQKLAAMAGLIDDTIVTVRRIATGLRPGVLDDLGLAAAVEWQAQEFEQRTGIRCALRADCRRGTARPTALDGTCFEFFRSRSPTSRATAAPARVAVDPRTLRHRSRSRSPGRRRRDYRGRGANTRSIGLAGMRERAQLVGGGLSISGAAGRRHDGPRAGAPSRNGRRVTGRLRILIVDDHPIVRQGLKQTLADAADVGEIGEAANGPQALDLVRQGDWDAVVLDIGLPGRGGIEILKDIKHERPRLPVLILSMHPEDQYAIRALRAGAGRLSHEGSRHREAPRSDSQDHGRRPLHQRGARRAPRHGIDGRRRRAATRVAVRSGIRSAAPHRVGAFGRRHRRSPVPQREDRQHLPRAAFSRKCA